MKFAVRANLEEKLLYMEGEDTLDWFTFTIKAVSLWDKQRAINKKDTFQQERIIGIISTW